MGVLEDWGCKILIVRVYVGRASGDNGMLGSLDSFFVT